MFSETLFEHIILKRTIMMVVFCITLPLSVSACYDPDRHPDGCSYASWVAPLLMTPYLLVANILLVNLLIARFK